jgi:AcrR family transcriptional regulator
MVSPLLSRIKTEAAKCLLRMLVAAGYQSLMDIRILVVIAAAIVAALFFSKLRSMLTSGDSLSGPEREEKRSRERMFRDLEDRAPS